MPRRNARTIDGFEMISLSEVPCRAVPPPDTEALGSDVDRILLELQKAPGLAAKIHEPDSIKRDSLASLINRIARVRANPVRVCQSGSDVFVWLRSED
jgi:hypothetical protein